MKRYYISLLLLSTLSGFSQIVNIPDANFKNHLLTELGVDTNGDGIADTDFDLNNDGEIDQDEALNIKYLYARDKQIHDFTGIEYMPNLERMAIGKNPITSLQLQMLHKLTYLECDQTELTSIDLCGTKVRTLWCNANPLLTSISVKNNVISPYVASRYANVQNNGTPPPLTSFQFDDLPMLQTVCYDTGELAALGSYTSNTTITFTDSCVSNCVGIPNHITGNIRYDHNGNGCDANDLPALGIPINIVQNSYNTRLYSGSTGNYSFYSFEEQITLTPNFQHPYYTVTPASYTTAFVGNGNTETVDFCLVPNAVHPDLEISLYPIDNARPGFNASYLIAYKNKGTETLSGQVHFEFDDSRIDFVSADIAVSQQSQDNLTFNFTALAPFERRQITVTFNVNSPMEIPAVNNGDVFPFTATVSSTQTDETPNDNVASLNQVVIGSVDPNDKLVAEGSTIDISKIGDDLHYMIRFQNVGTAAAEFIVVRDILADNLDKSTLEIDGASHPFRSTLSEGNKLEFFFDNINLPDATSNEPGSHGYVAFKIKPMSTVSVGSVLANTAKIYFDYNFPIVTNEVTTTVTALASNMFDKNSFVLYPNPANEMVNLNVSETTLFQSINIYNALGQLVQQFGEQHAKTITLDVSELKSGSYFMEINSNGGKTTKKFIKL